MMNSKHSISLYIALIQLIVLSSFTKADDPQLEFNYLPIAHVRTDPILSQTCLSDHVHTFYGAPLVRPEMTSDDLFETKPPQHSGLVRQNKSLYWHPSIYRYNAKTRTFTLDEVYLTSIRYTWKDTGKTFGFPRGFRMIAKDNNAFTNCVKGSFKTCSRTDGCESENTFFPKEACELLEVTMNFPTCWNGKLDSEDHMSHIAYANEDDSCPKSYDRRIPRISISVHIKDYDGGYHTFSDMTNIFHADYISGWTLGLMNTFIEGCKTNTENCHTFVDFKNGHTANDSVDEKHDKVIAILPPLPDTLKTVSSEPVKKVEGSLPRGTCTGTLIDPSNTLSPTKSPTKPPTKAKTCGKKNATCKKNADCCEDKCVKRKCKGKKPPPPMCRKKNGKCKKNSDCCKKKCVKKKCKK